jgi:hypothetical protein
VRGPDGGASVVGRDGGASVVGRDGGASVVGRDGGRSVVGTAAAIASRSSGTVAMGIRPGPHEIRGAAGSGAVETGRPSRRGTMEIDPGAASSGATDDRARTRGATDRRGAAAGASDGAAGFVDRRARGGRDRAASPSAGGIEAERSGTAGRKDSGPVFLPMRSPRRTDHPDVQGGPQLPMDAHAQERHATVGLQDPRRLDARSSRPARPLQPPPRRRCVVARITTSSPEEPMSTARKVPLWVQRFPVAPRHFTTLFDLIAQAQQETANDLAVTRQVANILDRRLARMGEARLVVDAVGFAEALSTLHPATSG